MIFYVLKLYLKNKRYKQYYIYSLISLSFENKNPNTSNILTLKCICLFNIVISNKKIHVWSTYYIHVPISNYII